MDGKKTALYEIFKKYNATFTSYGGFYMPVSFEGIVSEHQAVREHAECSIFHIWEKYF